MHARTRTVWCRPNSTTIQNIKILLIHDFLKQEILVVPPIQSPPRSDFIGTVSMKCHLCDYFANKHCNLIYHMSTHGRNLEFKCKLCNFSSAKKFALTNHTKNQHHLQLFANYDKNEVIIFSFKYFLMWLSFMVSTCLLLLIFKFFFFFF